MPCDKMEMCTIGQTFYINAGDGIQIYHLFLFLFPFVMQSTMASEASTLITLNIGGYLYETYYNTLMPSGYFKTLLHTYDKTHEVFVDRSGVLFEHVLQFLRNMHLVGDYTESELIELKEEAKYYDIKEMDQVIERRLYDLSIYMASREYKLIDLSELEQLSCIQESSVDTHDLAYSISDKYDIITVIKYTSMRHGDAQSKLLIAKK